MTKGNKTHREREILYGHHLFVEPKKEKQNKLIESKMKLVLSEVGAGEERD